MRLTSSVTLSALLVVLGCGDPVPGASPSGSGSGAALPPPPASGTGTAALAAAASAELSLPRTEAPWTDTELKSFARTLDKAGAARLPKKGDPVFERLVSPENYAFLAREDLPLNQRFPQGGEFLSAFSVVTKLYVAGMIAGQPLQKEVLALQVATTCASADMVPLVQQFVATLDPKDSKYEVRMKGLDQVKSGLGEIVAGGLMNLGEKSFPLEDRRAAATTSLPCATRLLSMMAPEARAVAIKKAEAMAAAGEDKTLDDAVKDFLLAAKLASELDAAKASPSASTSAGPSASPKAPPPKK